jgi:hypothetical protein
MHLSTEPGASPCEQLQAETAEETSSVSRRGTVMMKCTLGTPAQQPLCHQNANAQRHAVLTPELPLAAPQASVAHLPYVPKGFLAVLVPE